MSRFRYLRALLIPPLLLRLFQELVDVDHSSLPVEEEVAEVWRSRLTPVHLLVLPPECSHTFTSECKVFEFLLNKLNDDLSEQSFMSSVYSIFYVLRYLSISFLSSEVRIEGLETLDYLDNLHNKDRFTEQGDAITFESEVDRVYISTPTKIAILDHEKKRTFVLRKEGLPDAVVWNPWDRKAKAMPDFGDDEYKHMLCVEAAAVEKCITLKPGEEWKGRQELSAVPSSYCSGQLDPQKARPGRRAGPARYGPGLGWDFPSPGRTRAQ
ncbi:putative glucose-6-phosphate 1-epimerase [Nymphaea thermarum]|nr:putative glucose-6-phosphate 1-epimerase [Nymphaea thermarum]